MTPFECFDIKLRRSGGDNPYPATGRNTGLNHVLAEVQGKNGRKPTDKDNEQVKDKEEHEEEEEDKEEEGDEEDEDNEDELGELENVIKIVLAEKGSYFSGKME
jgi:hypothetical protein